MKGVDEIGDTYLGPRFQKYILIPINPIWKWFVGLFKKERKDAK